MTCLLFLLFAISPSQADAPAVDQSKRLEQYRETVISHVTVDPGGTLRVVDDAEHVLSAALHNAVTELVDLINRDIAAGDLAPFTETGLASRIPTLLCECLLGCCVNGYCFVDWGTYIGQYPCQP